MSELIKTHELNTDWWGEPVGLVLKPEFFDLPDARREELLSPFVWAEYKAPLSPAVPFLRMARCGFLLVDSQVPMSLDLTPVAPVDPAEGLEVRFGDRFPFRVRADEMRLFSCERFNVLPGAAPERINARYELWGNRIIEQHAASCLQVCRGGRVQGWFLSTAKGSEIEVALVMLHRDATVRGRLVYRAGFSAYAQRGFATSRSFFSVMNPAVMNVIAGLGARFSTPVGCWFWLRGGWGTGVAPDRVGP